MQPGKPTILLSMCPCYRQFAKALCTKRVIELLGQLKSASAFLDGDFPKTDSADVYDVI